jgi:polyisoprenoid-binding protein YceI
MMVTTVRGTLPILDLDLDFRLDDPAASSVRVTLDAAGIVTGQDGRDQHLRSADFLDAEQFPTIEFRSTSVRRIGDDDVAIEGDLTIRGVTRPVLLDAEFAGIVPNLQGGRRAAFSATTSINREDFGLTWNVALEQGGWLVGKEIKIEIDLAVTAPEAAASEAEERATVTV